MKKIHVCKLADTEMVTVIFFAKYFFWKKLQAFKKEPENLWKQHYRKINSKVLDNLLFAVLENGQVWKIKLSVGLMNPGPKNVLGGGVLPSYYVNPPLISMS